MPPALAAVAGVVASIGIKALAISALAKAVLTIAVSLAITALTKKPKANKLNQGMELRTKFEPNYPREVLVGKIATGGSCHFAYTTTDSSKKPNRYLYRVIQISDRPINALLKVMEGSQQLTFSGDVTTGWRACNQHKDKKGNTKMWVRVYKGSDTPTADATLISETGGIWTADHKGTGLAYAIVKYDYDADAFSGGEPELVWVVEGALLYDDRKDSTVTGGSGSQRLADYSTWEYTDTTSVIIAQFLRGFFTKGVPIVGVLADARDMTAPMLFSAHNTCELQVEIDPGGVFEKRYVSGMVIKANEAASDILVDLQASMDGKIFDRGGYITILPGADRIPVTEVTDDDIDWTAEKSWQPKASLEQMTNHVTGNFIDAEQNFQERELPVQVNLQWEQDDGDERFSQYYSLRAVNRWTQGQRILKRIHLSSRQSGTIAFVGGIWLLELEQGDWFTLTSPRWKMTDMYFEVQEISLTSDARVVIVGREVDPDNDVWDHSVDEVPRTDSTWNPPSYDLPVPSIYATQYTVQDPSTGGKTFNIDVGFLDDPALYGSIVKTLEVQLHWGSVPDGSEEPASVANFPVDQKKTTITGLASDTAYYVRGRLRDLARAGNWTTWIAVTTDIGDAISAGYGPFLSNATQQVITDSEGNIPLGGLDDAGGTFVVLKGGVQVTTGITFSVLSEVGADASINTTTGTYVINSMSADKGTVVFRAVHAGVTMDLTYQISKIIPGKDADPVFAVALSNEVHNVRTDAEGEDLLLGGANGNVIVSNGVANIINDPNVVIGTATFSGCTGTINTALNTPVSGMGKGYYVITDLTADSAYMDIEVTVYGVVYVKRFSLTKTRSGTALRLWTNRNAISYGQNGSPNPSVQDNVFTTQLSNASGYDSVVWSVATLTGAFSYSTAGKLVIASNTRSATQTIAQFESACGGTEGCRIKAEITVNGQVYEDVTTVMKSKQGLSAMSFKAYQDRYTITYNGDGVATPSTQTINFVAQKVNTSAVVTWTVANLNGTARTPTTSFLSSATGDVVTMTRAQYESAAQTTGGVIVTGTLTDGTTLTDKCQVISVKGGADGTNGTNGEPGVGYNQDSPVPVATIVGQTWYRPTTKEWYIARGTGCSTIQFTCWKRILGNLSGLDIVDTANIMDGAINVADWERQGAILGVGANGSYAMYATISENVVSGSGRVRCLFAFIYDIEVSNPVHNQEYSFTVVGGARRNSNGTYVWSGSPWTIAEKWTGASASGVRSFGRKPVALEFPIDSGLVNGVNYSPAFRIVASSSNAVTFYPYRFLRLDVGKKIE